MSSVTSVVILSGDYQKFDRAIEEFNAWIDSHHPDRGGRFKKFDRSDSAGTKCVQFDMIWGGFNYMYVDEFIELFKSLNLYDSIAIFSPEDGEEYSIVSSNTKIVERNKWAKS